MTTWHSIYMNRIFEMDNLRNKMSLFFGLAESEIAIGAGEETDRAHKPRLSCEISKTEGTFISELTLTFNDQYIVPENRIEALNTFCRVLECQLLFPPEGNRISPDHFLYVHCNGKGQDVIVERERLPNGRTFIEIAEYLTHA